MFIIIVHENWLNIPVDITQMFTFQLFVNQALFIVERVFVLIPVLNAMDSKTVSSTMLKKLNVVRILESQTHLVGKKCLKRRVVVASILSSCWCNIYLNPTIFVMLISVYTLKYTIHYFCDQCEALL